MPARFQVTIDCADPARLAEFWALALGYKIQDPPPGFASWPDFLRSIGVPDSEMNAASAIVDPSGAGSRVFFQRVPEPKTVKNRVHIDVNVAEHGVRGDERRALVDAHVERLVAAGATVVGPREQRGEHWVVLRDPEGNELCVQ
jgi:hypothetical protein